MGLILRSFPLVCILLCLCAHSSAWQECASAELPTFALSTSLMDCRVTGPYFKVTPKKSSGRLFPNTNIGIRILSIDQIQTVQGQPWNTVKSMTLAESWCVTNANDSVPVSSQIEQGADAFVTPSDATRRQVTVSMVGDGEFSNTVFNITVSAASTAYNITYTNITNTQGILLQYIYPANTIKISFSLENWPWDVSERDTHLIINFLGDLKLDSTFFLNYSESDFYSRLDLDAEQSKILLLLERGAIIDGTPFRDDRGPSDPIEYYWNTTETLWTFQVDFRFRNYSNSIPESVFLPSTTGFYKSISYDPTFSAIFTGSEIEESTTDPKAKRNKSIVIGASVGAVLGVVLLVGIFAIIVMNVPSVHDFIFPHAKRSQAHSKAAEKPKSEAPPSSWNRYKPA